MYHKERFYRNEWTVGSKAYHIRACFICGKGVAISMSEVNQSKPCHTSCLSSYAKTLVEEHRVTMSRKPTEVHVRDHPSKPQQVARRGST